MTYVDTTEFEASHGRKPRGYGSWGFSFKRNPEDSEIIWAQGAFTEAKSAAFTIARYRFPGALARQDLYVLP